MSYGAARYEGSPPVREMDSEASRDLFASICRWRQSRWRGLKGSAGNNHADGHVRSGIGASQKSRNWGDEGKFELFTYHYWRKIDSKARWIVAVFLRRKEKRVHSEIDTIFSTFCIIKNSTATFHAETVEMALFQENLEQIEKSHDRGVDFYFSPKARNYSHTVHAWNSS